MTRVSIAVPLFNEEAVVEALVERTCLVLDAIPGGPHEIVVVDDGSSDRTRELLRAAAVRDSRLVVVGLSRNFGHQAAITAALDRARGDVVVIMDGDLQDPPEVIPALLREYERGFDVVYVRRVERKESWFLRCAYFLAYRLIGGLSEIRLPVDAGDFGLLSRRVVEALRRLPEHHRYLRGLRAWVGFRQTCLTVPRGRRESGKSKYSLWKLAQLALDGAFAFSTAPLRAATLFGVGAAGVSGLFAVYSLYVKLIHGRSPEGFTALITAMTFLSGVQLLFLGIIGEYLGRVYDEAKARPMYMVESVVANGNVLDTNAAGAPTHGGMPAVPDGTMHQPAV